MDFSAPHIGFVVAAYALSGVVLAGLTLNILVRERRLRRKAAELDRHRSGTPT